MSEERLGLDVLHPNLQGVIEQSWSSLDYRVTVSIGFVMKDTMKQKDGKDADQPKELGKQKAKSQEKGPSSDQRSHTSLHSHSTNPSQGTVLSQTFKGPKTQPSPQNPDAEQTVNQNNHEAAQIQKKKKQNKKKSASNQPKDESQEPTSRQDSLQDGRPTSDMRTQSTAVGGPENSAEDRTYIPLHNSAGVITEGARTQVPQNGQRQIPQNGHKIDPETKQLHTDRPIDYRERMHGQALQPLQIPFPQSEDSRSQQASRENTTESPSRPPPRSQSSDSQLGPGQVNSYAPRPVQVWSSVSDSRTIPTHI